MYSLGEVNFMQGMLDFGNPKNSLGLKLNAELRKDAKAPSYNIVLNWEYHDFHQF